MKRIVICCIMLLGFIGCKSKTEPAAKLEPVSESVSKKEPTVKSEDELKLLPELDPLFTAPKLSSRNGGFSDEEKVTEFKLFFSSFVNAVNSRDGEKLKAVTTEILHTRGELDHYEVVMYDANEIPKVLQAFFEYELGKEYLSNLFPQALTAYVLSERIVTVTENDASIKSMVFEKSNGEWKLQMVYLGDEAIEKLKGIPEKK